MNAKQTFLKQYWDSTYQYFYTTDAVVKHISTDNVWGPQPSYFSKHCITPILFLALLENNARNKEIKGILSHFFQWVWFFLKTANLQHIESVFLL